MNKVILQVNEAAVYFLYMLKKIFFVLKRALHGDFRVFPSEIYVCHVLKGFAEGTLVMDVEPKIPENGSVKVEFVNEDVWSKTWGVSTLTFRQLSALLNSNLGLVDAVRLIKKHPQAIPEEMKELGVYLHFPGTVYMVAEDLRFYTFCVTWYGGEWTIVLVSRHEAMSLSRKDVFVRLVK